jgi:acetyltransferase
MARTGPEHFEPDQEDLGRFKPGMNRAGRAGRVSPFGATASSEHRAVLSMSTYRLDKLFSPQSVAVFGGSPRPTSPGRAVVQNLKDAGFRGAVHIVNPRYEEIEGIRSIKSFKELPEAPDLVVIATPAATVPSIVAAAGERGVPTGIIITAGLGHGAGSLADICEKTARRSGLRLVGPNCLGILAPGANLNASSAASMPRSGDLALIS